MAMLRLARYAFDLLFPEGPGGVVKGVSKQNRKSSLKKATEPNSSPGVGRNNDAADKLVQRNQ